jgi:hypothetical protein
MEALKTFPQWISEIDRAGFCDERNRTPVLMCHLLGLIVTLSAEGRFEEIS